MKLQLVRHLWGVELPWEQAFPKIKAEGFTAMEVPLPAEAEAGRLSALLKQHAFDYIAMAFTGGTSVREHVASFRSQLERAKQLGAVKLTCHSGADAWPLADGVAYFDEVTAIEKSVGLPVGHETHRGRLLFNPWQARDLLERVPALNLCCDFSHWVCIAERLLPDCGPILDLAASRCVHLHARVGYEQGPQVPDPSAPEYAAHLAAHEKWWDAIWSSQRARGVRTSTLTPEFGPPGYLHTLPHTNVPVADLWQVCQWVADRQAKRFAATH
ncbi:MAG TPA: sugar phosphate isomerase/epimerase [Tepidisphaeraceae bacterium]|nr:sugar phosphate isomerase/epimerase [Tepidisphaeraceae bacterium]